MPLKRFHNLDKVRKDSILQAAKTEFLEHGYAGASYNAIIKRCQISKGAMYYYFEDKDDLCRTVVRLVIDEIVQQIGPMAESHDAPSFWDSMRGMVMRATSVLLSKPELATLGRLIYADGQRAILGPLFDEANVWCTKVLTQGQALGAVRADLPLDLLANSVMALSLCMDRWFADNLQNLPFEELTRLSELSFNMVKDLASPNTGEQTCNQ